MKGKTEGKATTENGQRKGMLGSGIHLYIDNVIVITLGLSGDIGMFIWRMKIVKLMNFAKQVGLVKSELSERNCEISEFRERSNKSDKSKHGYTVVVSCCCSTSSK